MQKDVKVDALLTVNELMAREPRTMAVFNDFGIDTCCGAASPISEAAARDGADIDVLLAALRRAVEEGQ